MQELIPARSKIAPFLVFYLVMSMQIGIGVLSYQRIVAKYSSQDAWISVLFAGFALHLVLWIIYKIAEAVNGDFVSAHTMLLGNLAGKAVSSIFIVYTFFYSLGVLRTYIEVIQVWMFPTFSVFWYTLAYMFLCVYIIYGGFQAVTGMAFFGVILPAYLFFIFGFSIKFAELDHLFPIWTHSLKEILLGSYQMTLTYLGFEIILFLYPFIEEPQKSKKWAHLALLSTTFIYTALMILTITYFSEPQLEKTIWGTLSIWRIIQFSFIERFEYIGIASWSLVILPNVCIPMWVASRLLKRIFHLPQKKGVILVAIAILVSTHFLKSREQIAMFSDYLGKAGFIFTYVYIPLLFICVWIAKKVKKR